MLADRIRGGMLEVGGTGIGKDGSITVKNASDTQIGYWDKTGLHVMLGVIEGSEINGGTITGANFVGGAINIGAGTFYVSENGEVVINAGAINIGNVSINSNYTWIGDYGVSSNDVGLFYSRDVERSIQIYSDSWSFENVPVIIVKKGDNQTRITNALVSSSLFWCNDIYFNDPWADNMTGINMFKQIYDRLNQLRQFTGMGGWDY